MFSSLKGYYEISNRKEVYDFLINNDYLYDFLIEAARQIKNIFGQKTKIELEKIKDPEINNDVSLFAYIQIKQNKKLVLC